MTSKVFFSPRQKKMQWLNSRRPNNILILWTLIMQQALRISEWMIEKFPGMDFSSIKLNLNAVATSSLLQTGSEDANIEDNATTLPPQDDPNVNAPLV
nr:hypothetical protein CFP56_29715 [Quercus suber]